MSAQAPSATPNARKRSSTTPAMSVAIAPNTAVRATPATSINASIGIDSVVRPRCQMSGSDTPIA